MNWKRIVAREWLIFLGCWIGTPVLLVVGVLLFADTPIGEWEGWEALSGVGLAVWVLVMFVRSVVWAVRTVLGPNE